MSSMLIMKLAALGMWKLLPPSNTKSRMWNFNANSCNLSLVRGPKAFSSLHPWVETNSAGVTWLNLPRAGAYMTVDALGHEVGHLSHGIFLMNPGERSNGINHIWLLISTFSARKKPLMRRTKLIFCRRGKPKRQTNAPGITEITKWICQFQNVFKVLKQIWRASNFREFNNLIN